MLAAFFINLSTKTHFVSYLEIPFLCIGCVQPISATLPFNFKNTSFGVK